MPQLYEGSLGPLKVAGAPVNGTTEVQKLTIAGATGGTFRLGFEGFMTAPISWTSTDSTLVASIDAALEALPNIGSGGVAATYDSTLASGLGVVTITFSGANLAKKDVSLLTSDISQMTGDSTLAITPSVVTPGVDATYRNAPTGALLARVDSAPALYQNYGAPQAPSWQKKADS